MLQYCRLFLLSELLVSLASTDLSALNTPCSGRVARADGSRVGDDIGLQVGLEAAFEPGGHLMGLRLGV